MLLRLYFINLLNQQVEPDPRALSFLIFHTLIALFVQTYLWVILKANKNRTSNWDHVIQAIQGRIHNILSDNLIVLTTIWLEMFATSR